MKKMKELKLFNSSEFGEIRTTESEGQPMFSLIDVCRALEIKNPRQAKNRLSGPGVITNDVGVITGKRADGTEIIQKVPMTFVNEPNLYKLIFQSRKPEAEKFSDWVTEDVLPEIRKNGGYIQADESMSDSEIMARALMVAQRTIENINRKIEELTPKAEFADAVGETKSVILIRDLAKLICRNGYDIGERRLYQWMRDKGYICKNSTRPTQRAIESGWLTIVEQRAYRGDGQMHLTTKVTGKGQRHFIEKFLREKV